MKEGFNYDGVSIGVYFVSQLKAEDFSIFWVRRLISEGLTLNTKAIQVGVSPTNT